MENNQNKVNPCVHKCNRREILSNMVIGPHDVLCGRDKIAFNNVGNRRFRIMISLSINKYVSLAKKRKEKSQLIRSIVESTKECGGRFLQEKDGILVELSARDAHDKVGHAIRDMIMTRGKDEFYHFQKSKSKQATRNESCKSTSPVLSDEPTASNTNIWFQNQELYNDHIRKQQDCVPVCPLTSAVSMPSMPQAEASKIDRRLSECSIDLEMLEILEGLIEI